MYPTLITLVFDIDHWKMSENLITNFIQILADTPKVLFSNNDFEVCFLIAVQDVSWIQCKSFPKRLGIFVNSLEEYF